MADPLLLVGYGSIGARHLRTLRALDVGPVVVCEPVEARREQAARAAGVDTVATLEAGLARGPRAALICTPPAMHLSLALAAAEAGCHLFIEKPLAPTTEGVAELARAVARRHLTALVACNMRFHPGVRALKRWLDAGALGRVLSAHARFGHFLPGWRPDVDYRQVYSAHRAAGGGILLDAIHELDYLGWLLGPIAEVACIDGHVSDLEVDAEDTAKLLLRARSGAIVSVHLDYVERIKRRGCEVVGSEGTALWESRGKLPEQCRIERFDARSGAWESRDETIDVEAPFVEELRHFLRCVDGEERPLQDLAAGARAVALVEAARRAASTGATVAVATTELP
jgi:predicted dehydrogenase